jgi:NADH-quinone oxidoreductase subunit A
MERMTPLVAYVLLFVAVGAGFIFVHLMAGKLIRPARPDPEKRTIYECGEPTIGSAWVQFDLRFYVIALLFVIFDVEVAFFFPWAEVFGKANELAARRELSDAQGLTAGDLNTVGRTARELVPPYAEYTTARDRYGRWAGMTPEEMNQLGEEDRQALRETWESARALAWLALGEIVVFFGVLLVGFAYLWRRGDLAWVRTVGERPVSAGAAAPARPPAARQVLEVAGPRS